MPAEQPITDIDTITASLRSDRGDVVAFAEALASKLDAALPGRVTVKRSRPALLGPKALSCVEVDLSAQRLKLQVASGSLSGMRCRVSGGVVLKSEQLQIDDWLAALAQALAAEAQSSETTRQALERLLIG